MRPSRPRYQSNHWSDHPDVLAHIRMLDRTAGGKRLLHVEELQSDWAQEGRDKGFYDLDKPYQLYDWDKDKAISNHATREEAEAAWKRLDPETTSLRDMSSTNNPGMPHAAPYVQNTQHWTDLALKHVLREAALGNYDGIVFTPGQAQADRYGLEKHLDTLAYYPDNQSLVGYRNQDNVFQQANVKPEDVKSHVGSEIAERLLNESNARNVGTRDQVHVLQGNDLKAGGLGMKGYYDNIVPKSVMRLAQMHDPAAAPGQPVPFKGDDGTDYQGFHLPMTDKMRQGILNEGFPAMKRGGAVGYEDGGALPPAENAQKTQVANTLPTFLKAKDILDDHMPQGKSLDYGAGLGYSRNYGFDTYDPFPRNHYQPTYGSPTDIPDGSYHRLTCLNVLNVVPRNVRDDIVRHIGRVLAPSGHAVITTRGRDVLTAKGRAGPEPMSVITGINT